MRYLFPIIVFFTTASYGQLLTYSIITSRQKESAIVEDFGAIGDGVTNDRVAIQTGINYCAARNIRLIFNSSKTYLCVMQSGITLPSQSYCLTIPSNAKLYSSDNQVRSTIKFLPPKTAGNYSLKTSNFAGGTSIDALSVCAILIDQTTKKNDLTFNGLHFTTDLVRWYDNSNFIQMVPVCVYSLNTGVEEDANDHAKDSRNVSFFNCKFSNFKRGTVSTKGRSIDGVNIINCEFSAISDPRIQMPSDVEELHTEVFVDGLSAATTSYNFNLSDLYDVGVYLYNSSNDLIGVIPYTYAYIDPGLGQITSDIRTNNGLVQWTLGTLSDQVASISLVGVRKVASTLGTSINGVCFDGLCPCRNLTLTGCDFNNSLVEGKDHFIYITRQVDVGNISNNTFTGMPSKRYSIGGGVHIRGGSYNDVIISNNTFTNAKTNCVHISSFSNFTISNNVILYDKNISLGFPGSDFLTIGFGDGATYSNNTINCTNKVYSGGITSYGYSGTIDVTMSNNVFNDLSNITLVGKDLMFSNNTVSSHTNQEQTLLTCQGTTPSDILDMEFSNNVFTLSHPVTSSPIFEGFTGLTFSNNTLPSNIGTVRFGGSYKLNNLSVTNSTIPFYSIYSDGSVSLSNVIGTISITDQTVFNGMVTGSTYSCTNTRRAVQSTPVYNNTVTVLTTLDTDSYTISSSQSGVNIEWLDIRLFNNTSGFSYTITNSGSFTINILDRANATHANKNFENGGVNKAILPGQSITIVFDKVNNRWHL